MKIEEYNIREFYTNGLDQFLDSLVEPESRTYLMKKTEGLGAHGLSKYSNPEFLRLVANIELTPNDIKITQRFNLRSEYDTDLSGWNSLLNKIEKLCDNFKFHFDIKIRMTNDKGQYFTWADSESFDSQPSKKGTWKQLTKFYRDNVDLLTSHY